MTEEQQKPVRRSLARIRWRAAAIASGAAAVGIIALVALADPAPPPSRFAVVDSSQTENTVEADPLRTELARCRTLPADTFDARCTAAWEESRQRFMGESRGSAAPVVPPPIGRTTAASFSAASASSTDIPTPER